MRMTRIALFILVAGFASCVPPEKISKEGLKTYEKRNLKQFNNVAVSNSINVTLEKGTTNLATIETLNIDTEDVIVEVKGSTLNIYIKNSDNSFWNKSSWSGNVDIMLTYTDDLNEITARNSSIVRVKSLLTTENFELEVSNSAEVELEVDSDLFEVSVSNSGRANIKTNTKFLDARISNSGKLDINGLSTSGKLNVNNSGRIWAFGLKSEIVNANVSGSGTVEITVTKEMRANISNSGNVQYKGDPDKLIVDTSNSGRITKAD